MNNTLLKFTKLIIFLAICSESAGQTKLLTVTGEINVSETGTSLVHEHVIVDWIGADSTGYQRWNKSDVVNRALPFLLEAKEKGIQTFFECTPAYLGRDPYILRELSEKTGVSIVTNTGYYGVRNNKYVPRHAFEDSPEAIAQIWINEFVNGIDSAGIRPGFIKIGVDRDDTLSEMHEKLIMAAAIAHKATGLTIVSHTGPDGPAFAQIEILKNEGVSPEAFVWTHAQHGSIEGYLKAAREGAWISIDNVRNTPSTDPEKPGRIEWYVETLTKLKEHGILNKILLSHDSGWYNVGQENGGNYRGYVDIFDHLIPALKEKGFTPEDIELLLVKNPQKAYGIRVRML